MRNIFQLLDDTKIGCTLLARYPGLDTEYRNIDMYQLHWKNNHPLLIVHNVFPGEQEYCLQLQGTDQSIFEQIKSLLNK